MATIEYLGRSKICPELATIGRDLKATIHIADISVSREHAIIRKVDGCWALVDKSMNGCEVNARVTSKGDVFDLPTESTSVILIKGSNEDHRILFHPKSVHHSFSKEPPAKKRKFLESNLDIPGKIHESESQMLLKQVALEDTLKDKSFEQSVLETKSAERKKFYELEIGKLNDEYTAKISSLTERIQQGEKLQEEKDELIKTYNEEKEKLEKTKEEERKIQEGKLEIAKCEITKLIEEKNKIEQEHLAQVEELKQMLENKEKAYEEKISELTEKLEKEKKLETAEVIILGPEAISVTPDPCHEVVVLTSDEPSSSGICTQSTQQKSKAELLEELRQEKEAREKLEASMKRHIECLDSELSCSICSEVFVKPVKLPCLHTFCQTCILQWERNQRDCPMCRAKYTTVGRADSLLVCCIEKLIESTYTQDEKLKRAELVAARVELEKQLLPSTSDSGQTRGSRGRNSGQRGRGIPAIQPAHIRVGTMPTTIVQPASPHQVLRLTRMPGQHSWAVATNGRVITVRTTRGGQRPPWRF
ncbi:E3 ubiquitin-protein ligase rnf8-A-like isoform X2 [Artemia franciscana]|uniref:E3 ubiquitin-protein ligase CHFR n=1 Tax=Artemia franciscana TaxID=6661 RepID=A0AA88IP46_ARTSF|nr:hypothetical protein QYM36_001549 [Artemia franciscana]